MSDMCILLMKMHFILKFGFVLSGHLAIELICYEDRLKYLHMCSYSCILFSAQILAAAEVQNTAIIN